MNDKTILRFKGICKVFLTILLGCLSYFNLKLIFNIWNNHNLGYIFSCGLEMINHTPKFTDLIILCPIVGEYILLSLTVICLIGLFKKLKTIDEEGLLLFLIITVLNSTFFGMCIGLLVGLIFGLIVGLSVGLIFGLIVCIIIGLIVGLVYGLSVGLIMGSIVGIIHEFN